MSPSLLQVKTFIWVQSVFAVALVLGLLWAVSVKQNETHLFAVMLCIVAWVLGFTALGRKAKALPPEDRGEPAGFPRWIPLLLGVGECLNVAWWAFVGDLALLILPANLLVGGTIVVHWLTCNGLNLPVNRKSWGTLLVILALGTVWNLMGGVGLGAVLWRLR